jgi:hypothetical protein
MKYFIIRLITSYYIINDNIADNKLCILNVIHCLCKHIIRPINNMLKIIIFSSIVNLGILTI